MSRDAILERLRGDVSLPALPEVVSRLESTLADPEVDVRDVARLVMTDPVLSGQLLRMANSAYYARGSTEVASVQAAVQRLGMRAVRGLVYALSLPRLFPAGPDAGLYRALWKHALAVAAMGRELVGEIGGSAAEKDLAYMAGLVHDVGSLVFTKVEVGYRDFLDRCARRREDGQWDERDLCDLEQEEYGIDHAEVGEIFLSERWKMPSPIPLVVRHHHDMGWAETARDETARRLVAILNVSNGVCDHAGLSWDRMPTEGHAFREDAWECLGLDLSRVEPLMERMIESVEHAESLLSAGG